MAYLDFFTDGACSGNQNETNIGGWGAILKFGEHTKELHGGEINTTNNKMELMAVISAFQALKTDGQTVRIFTDSSYVASCFQEKWYVNWEKNGWLTAGKKPVENQPLWKELLRCVRAQKAVTFYRVKGHVNLDHPSTNVAAHYEKFRKLNGHSFSEEDFRFIISMNNRADALANVAMDELRP